MVQLNKENSELKNQINELRSKNQEQLLNINDLEMKLKSLKTKYEQLQSQRIYHENENEMLIKRDEYIKPSTSTSTSSSSCTSSNQLHTTNYNDDEIMNIKNQCINIYNNSIMNVYLFSK